MKIAVPDLSMSRTISVDASVLGCKATGMGPMRRRDFFRLAGAAAMVLPTTARAQFNASKPITMIVPFPAGGGADILVRLLTKYMGENLGHPFNPFIVQNQPGAGGGLAFG